MTTRPDELVVTARPVRTALISWVAAGVILVAFVVIAIVMPHANAGADFHWQDQLGTAIVGVVLAGTALLPTRPRLRADIHGVQARAYLGPYREIPWSLVVAVQFPDKLRFARLVLPGEETVALYAVQRTDRERSVAVMRGLRALFEAASSTPSR